MSYRPRITFTILTPNLHENGSVDKTTPPLEIPARLRVWIDEIGTEPIFDSTVSSQILTFGSGVLASYSFPYSWSYKTMRVEVTLLNYNTYVNTFILFGQDINIPIVLLKTVYDIFDGELTIPTKQVYSSMMMYKQPMTHNLYYYKLDSSDGDTITVLNNNAITAANGIQCLTDNILAYQIATVYETVNSGCCTSTKAVVDTHTSEEVLLLEPNWFIPPATITYSTPCGNETGDNIIIVNGQNHYIATLDFAGLSTILEDAEVVPPYASILVSLILYNYAGLEIDKVDVTVNLDYDLNVSASASTKATITCIDSTIRIDWNTINLPEAGSYVMNTEVKLIDVTEPTGYKILCKYPTQVIGEQLFSYESIVPCQTVRLFNRSFQTIQYSINKLQSNGSFVSIFSGDISRCGHVDLDITQDGIFNITSTINEKQYTYLFIRYCTIEACYLNYVKQTICDNPAQGYLVNLYDSLNFKIQVQTLFAQLNYEYGFNYMYDVIDSTKLAELVEIDILITRLYNQYCITCNSGKVPTSVVKLNTSLQCCN